MLLKFEALIGQITATCTEIREKAFRMSVCRDEHFDLGDLNRNVRSRSISLTKNHSKKAVRFENFSVLAKKDNKKRPSSNQ